MAHVFNDGNGRKIDLRSLTVTLMRDAKKKGLEWLWDIPRLFENLSNPVSLSDAVSFLSGKDQETIDLGLFGDSLNDATEAVVKAVADFYPERARKQIIDALNLAKETEEADFQQRSIKYAAIRERLEAVVESNEMNPAETN